MKIPVYRLAFVMKEDANFPGERIESGDWLDAKSVWFDTWHTMENYTDLWVIISEVVWVEVWWGGYTTDGEFWRWEISVVHSKLEDQVWSGRLMGGREATQRDAAIAGARAYKKACTKEGLSRHGTS